MWTSSFRSHYWSNMVVSGQSIDIKNWNTKRHNPPDYNEVMRPYFATNQHPKSHGDEYYPPCLTFFVRSVHLMSLFTFVHSPRAQTRSLPHISHHQSLKHDARNVLAISPTTREALSLRCPILSLNHTDPKAEPYVNLPKYPTTRVR